jgi:hypothetical protein
LLALQRVLTPALLALAVLLGPVRGWERIGRRELDVDGDPSALWSLRRPWRGPPALA